MEEEWIVYIVAILIILNLICSVINLVITVNDIKKNSEDYSIYDGIQDVMRDDEWDRIGNPNPGPVASAAEPPRHKLVATVGKRETINR